MTIPLEKARVAMLSRFKEILRDHLADELCEIERNDAAGLDLEAPAITAYRTLRNETAIAQHMPAHPITVYVYPYDEIDPVTTQSTGGPQRRVIRFDREVAVAIRIPRLAGDQDYIDPDIGELDADERDGMRLGYYIAAISQVVYQYGRDGQAITLAKTSRVDEDLDLLANASQSEIFGRVVFDVTQRVSVKQHNG